MGDEPGGLVTRAERCELDALRGRAYSPDADIFDDASAVWRLHELEDRVRVEHFPSHSAWSLARSPAMPAPYPPPLARAPVRDAGPPGATATSGRRISTSRRRRHAALVASTAAIGVVLALSAWSDGRITSGDAGPWEKSPAATAALGPTSYDALYELHLESLREELLSGPGMEEIAARMVRGLLTPHGVLFGRAVGAGPTVDRKVCMIVSDAPAPSIACLSIEDAGAYPVSVVLPAASTAPRNDRPVDPEQLVRYTLTPGGAIVAEPVQTASPP